MADEIETAESAAAANPVGINAEVSNDQRTLRCKNRIANLEGKLARQREKKARDADSISDAAIQTTEAAIQFWRRELMVCRVRAGEIEV